MNVDVDKTGPGVNCPMAMPSRSCACVSQPEVADQSALEERDQHVA